MSAPSDVDPRPPLEPAPGALVTSSIQLERELGSGGMGSVWVAHHLTLRAQVVVKFMARQLVSNPEARLRFEREATLAAQCKSPHVVQIFDHGISLFGLPYIAMELLEGEDLGQRIARQGPVPPLLFAGWLAQICRGLSRAHMKGITHRDIKPENLFLCEDDGQTLVKVLDFGIAKHDGSATSFSGTQTGAMLGTAYYMSPEQTLGERNVDHRTDLWALAVVTYYALTGTRPFGGNTLGALAIEITSGPLLLPSAKNAVLGAGVDSWMMKALSRPRELRFQSAKELSEAFDEAIRLDALDATAVATRARETPPTATTLASNAPLPAPVLSTMAPSMRSASDSLNPPQLRSTSIVGRWLAMAGFGLLLGVAFVAWRRSSSVPTSAPHTPPLAASSASSLSAALLAAARSLTAKSSTPLPASAASAPAVVPARSVPSASTTPAVAKARDVKRATSAAAATAQSPVPPAKADGQATDKPLPPKSPLDMPLK